jgi:hypothetical protein
LPEKDSRSGSRHPDVVCKKAKNDQNEKTLETSPGEDSEERLYTPPIMKGLFLQLKKARQIKFKFPKVITGLVETKERKRPIVKTIEPNTLVKLCSGMEHSQHPRIVYVKPLEGAEDWLKGQGIAVSIHHLEPL